VFGALGRFDYRFRRWIPPVGLVLVIGLSVWASQAGGDLSQGGWQIEGSESLETTELQADRFGEQATALFVILRDPADDAASDDFAAVVDESVASLANDPAVDEIVTYADSGDARQLSTDGTTTFALVRLNSPEEEAVEDSRRLVDLVVQPEGVDEMWVTGVPVVYEEFNAVIEEDLRQAEIISLPIAGAILLVVFGTLVGAGLPLLIAGLSLVSTMAAIGLLANEIEMSIFVTNLAIMIGLALAIDYSLFLVSRFREELLHHPVDTAVERTMATVGKAVAVSGIAVAIGLAALIVFEADALRSMGIGGVVVVVATLLYGLTVLPAILALLGHRVNRLKVPVPRFFSFVEDDPVEAERRHGRGFWSKVAARVMRRPVLIGAPILLILLIAGIPFLHINLSTGGNLDDLPDTPAKEGFIVLRDEFPGGDSDPMIAAVTYPGEADLTDGGLTPERLDDLQVYVDELAALHDVEQVDSVLDPPPGVPADQYLVLLSMPEAWPDGFDTWVAQTVAGDTTKVTVFSTLLPDSEEGRGLVAEVRAVDDPAGAEVGVTGLAARSADFMDSFRASVPVAVAIVFAVTMIVLFLTFGSVFLPVKAVLMSLVSLTASFGALVWIFQDGNLSGLLNFEATGSLGAWIPILMFAILFGLSMDYEVLLLSRIRERWLATRDNTRSVAEGIGITGGIITGAALIMVVVFSAFALSDVLFLKAIGFSMALAVLIDATIIRGILVPAFMRVMGRLNWWAPAWVQRAVARLGLYEAPGAMPASPPGEPSPGEPSPGEASPASSP
jgi:RND superfamily putative drug exporter